MWWILGQLWLVFFVFAILNWYYDRRGRDELLWLLLAIFIPIIGTVLFFIDRTYKKL